MDCEDGFAAKIGRVAVLLLVVSLVMLGFAEWPGARVGILGTAWATGGGGANRVGGGSGGGVVGIGVGICFLGEVGFIAVASMFSMDADITADIVGADASRFLAVSGWTCRSGDDFECGNEGFVAAPVLSARSVGSELNGA